MFIFTETLVGASLSATFHDSTAPESDVTSISQSETQRALMSGHHLSRTFHVVP